MLEITPQDTRYIPVVQQRWCCVPACISMIMYKHNIPLVAQEYLGYHLGLVVPKEGRNLFWQTRTGKKPQSGWGTQIEHPQFSINDVLTTLRIPLHMKLHKTKSISKSQLIYFFLEAINNDKDLVLCFDNGTITNTRVHSGHVCLLDRIDEKTQMIRLIDPSATQPKWRFVTPEALLKGMNYRYATSGGIWEFSKGSL